MIHHNSCPLCSSPGILHFLTCLDYFLTKEEFEICKCDSCGFIFTQDYPDESEAGYYYESEEYISHSDSRTGITDKAYQAVRRIMLRRKMKFISRMTEHNGGSILDIGSGTGHFLNIMKMAGWQTKGIEINKKAREYSSSRFNIEVISPERIDTLPDNSFDCITLWHVLEHFHDLPVYLKEIIRILKPQGFCFIALPNSDSFDCRHYGKEWAAWDVPRHLWHFNYSTFSLFAKKNRFTISRTLNLPFDVFYISILSEKYRGSRFPFISGAINGLIFSIRSFLNKAGSSSVIYILRKKDS
jgi:ubiquinone/menaquinone biosynthesis C-methylase UbiE